MKLKGIVETIIFSTRWLLIPFYLVLMLALVVYTYFDIMEFVHYVEHLGSINKETAMITFVELIDVTMIANLGKMIITGSYTSFVSKQHSEEAEKTSSGLLKVKMATSMVGVTAIGLLQRSMDVVSVPWDVLYKIAFVHVIFLLSSIILALVDYLHEKTSTHDIPKTIH